MKIKSKFIFLGLILLGAIIRVGYLVTPHMDADQAEFALQAMHIADGEFPSFSWAYAYIGTLPSFLAAIFFKIFGVSRLSFNGATFFLSFFFMWIIYRTGKLMFSRRVAYLCLLFATVAPYYQAFHCAWGRHGYLETLLFGSCVLYFTLYIVKHTDSSKKIKGALALGLLAGAGFWTNYLIIYYFPAAAIVLFFNDKKIFARKYFYVACASFFVGSLPFWVFNFTNNFASFEMLLKPTSSTLKIKESLMLAFSDRLPKALGIINYDTYPNNPATVLLLSLIHIAGGCFLLLRLKDIFKFIFFGKKECFKPIDIMVFFLFFLFLIYCKSAYIQYNTARYLLPIYSAVPFVFGYMFMKLRGKKLKLLGMLILIVLLNFNIYSNLSRWAFLSERNYDIYKNDMLYKKKLLEFVTENNIKTTQSFNYWTAPLMTFDLKEKLICGISYDRYTPYAEQIAGDLNRGFLMLGKNINIENTMHLNKVSYDFKDFGGYGLYYNIKNNTKKYKLIPLVKWHVQKQHDIVNVHKIHDGNITTFGRTITKQRKGDSFTVALHEVLPIAKVTLFLGTYKNDFPRDFLIETSLDGNIWKKTVDAKDNFCFYSDGIYFGSFPQGNVMDIVFDKTEAKYIRFTLASDLPETSQACFTLDELFIYTEDGENDFSDRDEIVKTLAQYIKDGKAVYASPYFMASLDNKGVYNPFDYTYYDLKEKKYFIDTSSDFVMCVGQGYEDYVVNLLTGIEMKYETKQFRGYTIFEVKGGEVWNLKWEYYVPFFVYSKNQTLKFEQAGKRKLADKNYAGAVADYETALKYTPSFYPALKDLHELYVQTGDIKATGLAKRIKQEYGDVEKQGTIFSNVVDLVSIDFAIDNNIVTLNYEWKCLKEISCNLFAYVHFKDKDGKILFQQDHMPTSGVNPTHFWIKGEIIKESLSSRIPPQYLGKKIFIELGLWNPYGDCKKLKVISSPYKHDGNTLKIGEFATGENIK